MVQIYRKKWNRSSVRSLLQYLRDFIIFFLPVKRLPVFLVKLLYGFNPEFAFLVHPRTYEDSFRAVPVLKLLKLFFRKKKMYALLLLMPPFILNSVRTKQGINGIVVGQFIAPEIMFERRKQTLTKLENSLRLISKIGIPNTVVGLGGWFPMISRRGLLLEKEARRLGLRITNGHCGTLASIYMTVEKIAEKIGLSIKDLRLSIIGVGRMGTNVAKAFNQKITHLYLIDINENNLRKAKIELDKEKQNTVVETVISNLENISQVRNSLRKSHIGICAASNFRNVLKIKDMPEGFIAIDDSRPEALPRDPKNTRIILEGGLLKVKGADIDYNFGFGEDDNVFGCLGESFLLALDKQHILKPTLGEVDLENLKNFIFFCKANQVEAGDLKTGDCLISDEEIQNAFGRRNLIPSS